MKPAAEDVKRRPSFTVQGGLVRLMSFATTATLLYSCCCFVLLLAIGYDDLPGADTLPRLVCNWHHA
jgi:hypothetical protein